ncbi:MAG: hypothetical protein WD512_06120, partial [Candidatus Paceibacterota bacterium]
NNERYNLVEDLTKNIFDSEAILFAENRKESPEDLMVSNEIIKEIATEIYKDTKDFSDTQLFDYLDQEDVYKMIRKEFLGYLVDQGIEIL